jgi:hypothetical protein
LPLTLRRLSPPGPDGTRRERRFVVRSIIAGLSPEDRLRTAFDLSDSVREIRIAGLLTRNPGWTRTQAVHELVLRDTGIDLTSVS